MSSRKVVPIEALHDERRKSSKVLAENKSLQAELMKAQADMTALMAFLGHVGFSISAVRASIKAGD
jgi:hypothetical protein